MEEKIPKTPSSFSVLETLALEVESISRDLRAALTRIDASEKGAVTCAIVMFLSCFLPWFSPNHTHTQTGLDGFATPHFGISVAAILLIRRVARERRLVSDFSSVPQKDVSVLENGRIALYLLLLGALSTLTCIALLIHFGDIAAFSDSPVDVRYGFYFVLISGLALSACGIAKLS